MTVLSGLRDGLHSSTDQRLRHTSSNCVSNERQGLDIFFAFAFLPCISQADVFIALWRKSSLHRVSGTAIASVDQSTWIVWLRIMGNQWFVRVFTVIPRSLGHTSTDGPPVYAPGFSGTKHEQTDFRGAQSLDCSCRKRVDIAALPATPLFLNRPTGHGTFCWRHSFSRMK